MQIIILGKIMTLPERLKHETPAMHDQIMML